MGDGSKIVVSGDITQVDLPGGVTSGLRDAWHRLGGIRGVSFVKLESRDIVRHRLVQDIVDRYEAKDLADARRQQANQPQPRLDKQEHSEPDSRD
jgi:phosphate starvation-inducible PhoH-like protein